MLTSSRSASSRSASVWHWTALVVSAFALALAGAGTGALAKDASPRPTAKSSSTKQAAGKSNGKHAGKSGSRSGLKAHSGPEKKPAKSSEHNSSEHKSSEHKRSAHKPTEHRSTGKTDHKAATKVTHKPAAAHEAHDRTVGKHDAKSAKAGRHHHENKSAGRPAVPKLSPARANTPDAVAPAATLSVPVARTPPPQRAPVAPMAMTAAASTSRADLQALENVITLIRKDKPSDATDAEGAIQDPLARKLAEWILLRSANNGASFERYRAFLDANPSWPLQSFLRRKLEASLWDDHRDDATVMSWFQNEQPVSAKGKFALARALLARGDRAAAQRLVRDAWRDDWIPAATEDTALDLFGALLAPGDTKARMDRLLYSTSDTDSAMRAAKRLGPAYVALAKARIAANRKASNARALLAAVPSELHSDPGYIFSRIQVLRREEKLAEAARLMMSAPRDPAKLYNLDEWWIERRLVARKLIDVGDYRTAYLIARDSAEPSRGVYKTEREFTAGWIALRFLHDPATAARHFARIGLATTNPTALARAGYWQGRAAEAAGRTDEARNAYRAAAEHSTSYYGQLARARLGLPQIALNSTPVSHTRGVERFEIVRAIDLLYAIDERELAIPILHDMGENGEPDVLVGLAEAASRNGDARGMLIVGKAALNRGLPFDFYAYPVSGMPSFRPIGPEVERSIVYAIARQESAFNPRVVSPAHAYGLMQVTPDAGRYVCRKYGAHYDLARLKSDPVYNTALGAAELGGLINDYRGSYIMTFAAYNAGRGSVAKWVARYGDPRDPKVDAVDWVELIPFSETRNYVQRIMENLQVYRARFGGGSRLQIEADLHRGSVE